jgi:hypothetical protein
VVIKIALYFWGNIDYQNQECPLMQLVRIPRWESQYLPACSSFLFLAIVKAAMLYFVAFCLFTIWLLLSSFQSANT